MNILTNDKRTRNDLRLMVQDNKFFVRYKAFKID